MVSHIFHVSWNPFWIEFVPPKMHCKNIGYQKNLWNQEFSSSLKFLIQLRLTFAFSIWQSQKLYNENMSQYLVLFIQLWGVSTTFSNT